MMSESPLAHPLRQSLTVTTAGAPPSPTIIETFADLNVRVVHVYGLTETYGPYTVCETQDSWPALPVGERSRLKSRQGVGMLTADEARVVASTGDPLVDVPADGVTMGEIVMRGNTVMKEYFRDPHGTAVPSAVAGSTPAIWGCGIPTATSSCWTGRRTSSSPVARTSPPSRWRTR